LFPLFPPPPPLCVGISRSYFNILNVVNYNMCVHTRAIIFILTSNLGDPTLEFQRPIWAIIFILTSNSNDPTLEFHQLLNHYVFIHRLVYLIYLILFGNFFENCGCIFDFFKEKNGLKKHDYISKSVIWFLGMNCDCEP